MATPTCVEAAVVGVPDEKWDERPLACVVLAEGAGVTPGELREYLSSGLAKWQLPDALAFIDEVPKTSVGKFDKKVLRRRYAEGELAVERTERDAGQLAPRGRGSCAPPRATRPGGRRSRRPTARRRPRATKASPGQARDRATDSGTRPSACPTRAASKSSSSEVQIAPMRAGRVRCSAHIQNAHQTWSVSRFIHGSSAISANATCSRSASGWPDGSVT